ncbi:MAG: ribosome small subunit-dependent GTPase A [Clostridia bacterium]|nr:ribosome small subunit-dependent GTPase A [Clostridia bacterium]
MALLNGRIIQSISGFYFVEAADAVFECKAKGSFRKKNITPLVGDNVVIETADGKGTVVEIFDRKNSLVRPPIANIDILFIVASVDDPKPNLYVIDKLTAFANYHGIEPIIVFSKSDLADAGCFLDIYNKSGMKVICCSSEKNEGIDSIRELITGKVCAFTGNSGVGKSSILNAISPELELPTASISSKLGRGKHTTRIVSLYKLCGGYVADTPGFSSIDLELSTERIYKDELPDCFPEFGAFTDGCKFSLSCSHVTDKGCAVLEAVKNGDIAKERHESYVRMYNEVKNFKKWEE